MKESRQKIDRLCRLARTARKREPARTPAPGEVAGIARRALRESATPDAGRSGWTDYFERLCWWGAGATAAACVMIAAATPDAPPDAGELLIHWPAKESAVIPL